MIDEEGTQIGIMNTREAIALAKDRSLDLVEVSPKADPPVCKIMDYGKYLYKLSKKERESKKKQHIIQVKEIRFRPGIEEHDFRTKLNHVKKFLDEKNKVKITVMFRGRELTHREFGKDLLDRIKLELGEIAVISQEPQMEGRNMVMYFMPK